MNGHHEDKCLNMITILCSIVNMVFYLSREGGGDMGRDVYDHLVSTKIFALIRNKKLIRAPQNHEEIGYYLALDLLTILY